MNVLVTGGCGFPGKHLVLALLKKKHNVTILDNLSSDTSEQNLEEIKSYQKVNFFQSDISIYKDVKKCIKESSPHFVYHLAGQHSIAASVKNPARDAEINIVGTLNLLEALRHYCKETPLLYVSTSYVYGKLENIEILEDTHRYSASYYPNGFTEDTKKDAHLPNTCSIGAAEQYVIDYRRLYGLRTAVFRQSQIVGNRISIKDEDFIEHIVQTAVLQKKNPTSAPVIDIYGNGKDVCDILHISDLVLCYLAALEYFEKIDGHYLNIGGGVENSISKLELLIMLEEKLGIKLEYKLSPKKKARYKYYITNFQKARSFLHWGPKTFRDQSIQQLVEFYMNH